MEDVELLKSQELVEKVSKYEEKIEWIAQLSPIIPFPHIFAQFYHHNRIQWSKIVPESCRNRLNRIVAEITLFARLITQLSN